MQSCEEEHPSNVSEPSENEVPREAREAEDGEQTDSKSPKSSQYYSSVSSIEKERQIPIDPMSLRNFGMLQDDGPLSAPSVFTEVVVHSPLLPPLRKPMFVSASLPCSAASSPLHGAAMPSSARKWDEVSNQQSPPRTPRFLGRHHAAALSRFATSAQNQPSLSRSMSYAEGRSSMPANELGFCSGEAVSEHLKQSSNESFFMDKSTNGSVNNRESQMPKPIAEDNFKCGALCLYLPGFSKKKSLLLSKTHREQEMRSSSVSRVASLEKFECASWSSPTVVQNGEENHYNFWDFPLELVKNSCSDDVDMPIKMAFVFDGEPRGILKKTTSRQDSSKSHRHVRFSTTSLSCPSSPSACITPRLIKARAEFNAFLEAQSV